MRSIILFLPVFLFLALSNANAQEDTTRQQIYQYTSLDIFGDEFDFATLKGKKIIIVNTASECGLTPQYLKLQEIYEAYAGENLVVVGFPSNDFLRQEPGTNEEIAEFCTTQFGVTFPMMAKISVKGLELHPVYEFLTKERLNGLENSSVQWNFQKYLIGEEGYLEKVVPPRVQPDDPKIISWIEGD